MSQIKPASDGTGRVYVFDTSAAPWTEAGMDSVFQKMARASDHCANRYPRGAARSQIGRSAITENQVKTPTSNKAMK